MKTPLRHAARSSLLRLLAGLAWLLLAAVPVHSASMPMPAGHAAMATGMNMPGMGMQAPSAQAASVASIHACAHADDCCGDAADHDSAASCHCAATFSTALTDVSTLLLLPLMPDRGSDAAVNASARDGAHRPPLRPPAA